MNKNRLLLSFLLAALLFAAATGQSTITSPTPVANGLFGQQVSAGGSFCTALFTKLKKI